MENLRAGRNGPRAHAFTLGWNAKTNLILQRNVILSEPNQSLFFVKDSVPNFSIRNDTEKHAVYAEQGERPGRVKVIVAEFSVVGDPDRQASNPTSHHRQPQLDKEFIHSQNMKVPFIRTPLFISQRSESKINKIQLQIVSFQDFPGIERENLTRSPDLCFPCSALSRTRLLLRPHLVPCMLNLSPPPQLKDRIDHTFYQHRCEISWRTCLFVCP